MKIIFLSERYREMLEVYKKADFEQGFSQEAIFELFNPRDLSIIRVDTIAFMEVMPPALRDFFELHDRFSSIILDYQVKTEVNFKTAANYSFRYTALNDGSILATIGDAVDSATSMMKAIERGKRAEEIIGTPIWDALLSM